MYILHVNLCCVSVVFQIFNFSLSDEEMNEILTKCDCNLRVLTFEKYAAIIAKYYMK